MTWLIEPTPDHRRLADEFRAIVSSGPIVRIPGTHDGMAARIAKQAGFKAVYLSGAAYAASRGLPDLGLVYSNEMADRARDLVRASGLPLLADIDTGYGGVLNAARTAKEMAEANVAAVQLEDQELPKKCGHLGGKTIVPAEEMIRKIRAIKEVCPTMFLLARTDAKSTEGLDAAIERAKRYADAGADGVFPEALETEEEFRRFRSEVTVPLLANMTEFGKTPYYTAEQFEAWGYNMVLYPVTSLRVAAKAYERVFAEIRDRGTQRGALADMQTRKELYETIRYYDYEELDGKIAKSTLPTEE